MKENDYQKLIEEYEKLNSQRADMYPLSLEDTFKDRRREITLVCSKDNDFASKIKLASVMKLSVLTNLYYL